MPGQIGTLVAGRYLLSEPVGQDGADQVWRAHDQLLDREVAVKEVALSAESPDERAELLARAMGEVRAAAKRERRGDATIYDVVEYDDAPWIIMRFVPAPVQPASVQSAASSPARGIPSAGQAPGVNDDTPPVASGRREIPLVSPLAAAARSNPRLAVSAATAIAMVLALILVVTLFTPSHRPSSPPSPPTHSVTP